MTGGDKDKDQCKMGQMASFSFYQRGEREQKCPKTNDCMTNIGNMFTITNMRNSYILLKELIIIIKSVPVTNQTSYIDGIS